MYVNIYSPYLKWLMSFLRSEFIFIIDVHQFVICVYRNVLYNTVAINFIYIIAKQSVIRIFLYDYISTFPHFCIALNSLFSTSTLTSNIVTPHFTKSSGLMLNLKSSSLERSVCHAIYHTNKTIVPMRRQNAGSRYIDILQAITLSAVQIPSPEKLHIL